MATFHIHIGGKVQGVGFRPFIYRLATQMQLTGTASNHSDGVHITVTGREMQVQTFYNSLSENVPASAEIQTKSIERIHDITFSDFSITKNNNFHKAKLLITPDLSLCNECREELSDETSRRFRYPFITCTNCGPRYSIMERIPYDRENTSMHDFSMCACCESEYNNVNDRRFYSQTNSCTKCAIPLRLWNSSNKTVKIKTEEIITSVIELLTQGRIIAVKGIGGFLLMADATNVLAIESLRIRKNRPAKPFAVMYPSLELVQKDFYVGKEEQEALCSSASPIVLLGKKENTTIHSEVIASGLNRIGVLLPYTPLFELILDTFRKPIIATSANIHGHPILFNDEDAIDSISDIADAILGHDREILIPQDDSVVQFSERYRKKIMLRRARGYAPSSVPELKNLNSDNAILALGADLKSTFGFHSNNNIYISQYLGDLSSYDNLRHFEHGLQRLSKLVDFTPEIIVTDYHPGYTSVKLGEELAREHSVPWIKVQHHEAHFAAVLAENDLVQTDEPVLGIIWDGTGLGKDHWIRGGEFLLYHQYAFSSLGQIEPYSNIAGDRMSLEPRIAALALCHDLNGCHELLSHKFLSSEWNVYHTILKSQQGIITTSMGRVFDAVASLLGLCDKNHYEGEAAMLLEALALKGIKAGIVSGYKTSAMKDKNFPIKNILQQLLDDILLGVPQEFIAARFHITLVSMIEKVATHFRVSKLAFSGGVFQNSLLTDLIIDKLSGNFHLYFHEKLAANDECLSFGQLMWKIIDDKRERNLPDLVWTKKEIKNQTV